MFDKSKFAATKADGVATLVYEDDSVFKKGTEIPIKTLEEVHKYQNKYIEEATELASEVAKEQFKKDKSLEKVSVKYPYSVSKRGFVDVTVYKEREFRNTITGNGEIIRKPAISVNVKDPATKVSKPKITALVDDLIKTFNK